MRTALFSRAPKRATTMAPPSFVVLEQGTFVDLQRVLDARHEARRGSSWSKRQCA